VVKAGVRYDPAIGLQPASCPPLSAGSTLQTGACRRPGVNVVGCRSLVEQMVVLGHSGTSLAFPLLRLVIPKCMCSDLDVLSSLAIRPLNRTRTV